MKTNSSRVVISGGSGFIGRYLSLFLIDKGYQVVVLTRNPSLVGRSGEVKYILWDGCICDEWCKALEGATAVINLSGRNINCRLTESNKRSILESRVKTAKVILKAINNCSDVPRAFIQFGAIGYYGNTMHECTESTPRGDGFLSDVCSQLEDTVNEIDSAGVRKCIVRLGVVLGRSGGAFPVLKNLTKCFMGGTLGNGRQYVSWVHINDVCRIVFQLLSDKEMEGVYNAVAPGALSNHDFMRAFRLAFRRPWSPPVPATILNIGTSIIGCNSTILLEGQNVSPDRLLAYRFDFEYSNISSALKELSEI